MAPRLLFSALSSSLYELLDPGRLSLWHTRWLTKQRSIVYDRERLLSFVGFVSNQVVHRIAFSAHVGACPDRFEHLNVFSSIVSVTENKRQKRDFERN